MQNNAGHLSGFARGNLFILKGGALLTPPLSDGVLDGIVRHVLLTGAGSLGLAATETSLQRADLAAADAAFITNSLLGVVPIRRLDGTEIGQSPEIAARLAELLV
jgi:branched-chain amino acid aminotransferase